MNSIILMLGLMFASALVGACITAYSAGDDDGVEPEPTPTVMVASIGETDVPATLQCKEDEVIGWVWMDTLACVHIETIVLRETGPEPAR